MQSVCVLGLGYIGLPTASILAANGFKVLGVDISERVVTTVNNGDIHIEEPGLKTLVRAAAGSGNLRAALTAEPSDVFILALPTPLTKDCTANMEYVVRGAESVASCLRPGTLVILESTSPPGTCGELVKPILETTGLTVGSDIHLAYCPERVLPGKILKELIENDRVVGGFSPACAERARNLYASFVEGRILLTDATTAEMVKLLENTFRDVNIALANEIGIICEKLGVDFWEVAGFANRHPRVRVHNPGPGVGGHCIPVDPWFLVEKYPEEAQLIRRAREQNDGMPLYVAEKIHTLLKGVENPKVAALGLAYKGNIDDVRESPAVRIVDLLRKDGIEVVAYDPHVEGDTHKTTALDTCLAGADCLLVLTDHNEFRDINASETATHMRGCSVLDTRNTLDHSAWADAGFDVHILGVGRP